MAGINIVQGVDPTTGLPLTMQETHSPYGVTEIDSGRPVGQTLSALDEWKTAEARRRAAMLGETATLPEAGDVTSNVQSQIALDKFETGELPDPFEQEGRPNPMNAAGLAATQTPGSAPLRPKTSAEFAQSTDVTGPGANIDLATGSISPQDKAPKNPLIGGINGPTSFASAADEKAAYEGVAKARTADAATRELNRLQQNRERALAKNLEEQTRASEEYRKTLSAEQIAPWWKKALNALAIGMGTYASGMTGMPNYALDIYNKNREADRKKREAKIATAAANMKTLGAKQEQIEKLYEIGLKSSLAIQDAQSKLIEAKGMQMLSRFPQQQQKLQEMLAAEDAKFKKDAFDTYAKLYDNKVKRTETEQKVITFEGDKSGGRGPQITDAQAKKAQYGTQIMEASKMIKDAPELSENDLRTMQKNMLRMKDHAENSTKGLFGADKVIAMRALNIAPESLTEGMSSTQAKQVARGWMRITNLELRDESGAAITNPEDIANALRKIPQPGEGPEEYWNKHKESTRNGEIMLKLAGPAAAKLLEAPRPGMPQSEPATKTISVPKKDSSGKNRWSEMDKEHRDGLKAAHKVAYDPKETPERRKRAQQFIKDVAEGRI